MNYAVHLCNGAFKDMLPWSKSAGLTQPPASQYIKTITLSDTEPDHSDW